MSDKEPQSCETCDRWSEIVSKYSEGMGTCICPTPDSITVEVDHSMYKTEGNDCPCWKPKEPA